MKTDDALRLERCLDGRAPETERERHRFLSQSQPDIRRADEDARLVRNALRRVLAVDSLDTDIAASVRAEISRTPRESGLERWWSQLREMFYQPTFRWAAAVAVLAALLLPVGYWSAGLPGEPAGLPSQIHNDYLDSDLPGATLLVETMMDDRGNKDEIVWVIADEGATL